MPNPDYRTRLIIQVDLADVDDLARRWDLVDAVQIMVDELVGTGKFKGAVRVDSTVVGDH